MRRYLPFLVIAAVLVVAVGVTLSMRRARRRRRGCKASSGKWDGEEVAKRIAADQDRGESLNIDRTPVLFINGEQIASTARDEKSLRAVIDKALGAQPR